MLIENRSRIKKQKQKIEWGWMESWDEKKRSKDASEDSDVKMRWEEIGGCDRKMQSENAMKMLCWSIKLK